MEILGTLTGAAQWSICSQNILSRHFVNVECEVLNLMLALWRSFWYQKRPWEYWDW